jgi:hypothetical protein
MTKDAKPAATRPEPARPAQDKPRRKPVPETDGPSGPEPTRYGDWERGGRCVDF